jgi:hypothetical protein
MSTKEMKRSPQSPGEKIPLDADDLAMLREVNYKDGNGDDDYMMNSLGQSTGNFAQSAKKEDSLSLHRATSRDQ